MTTYEAIPTIWLAEDNELITPTKNLAELVHLNDQAETVFTDFAKITPGTTESKRSIDTALYEMRLQHQPMLLVTEKDKVRGMITFEDILGEHPLRVIHDKRLTRAQITVSMLMQPQEKILTIDIIHLKHAQVGHIVNTFKKHAVRYILVVKEVDQRHQVAGFFSALQMGKQLHIDLSALLSKGPETIVELTRGRKI